MYLNDNYYKQAVTGLLKILEYKGVISEKEYVQLMRGHFNNDDREFITGTVTSILKLLRNNDTLSRKEYNKIMSTRVWEVDELIESWEKVKY